MWITVFGVVAVSFMMAMYALESRGPRFVLLFSLGCVLSSAYGFLSGAWPFGVVELIWSGVAFRRYIDLRATAEVVGLARPTAARTGRMANPSSAPAEGETTTMLWVRVDLRVEQIVTGSADPDELYDQDHDEWVLVQHGAATLEVDGEPVGLEADDWILIPAHCQHRVLSADRGTSWLAVHALTPRSAAK